MSDLHQYELHYTWTEPTTGGAIRLTRLVWAYSVQEAVFQLDFELKPRNDRYYQIKEAGAVKKIHTYGPGTKFHVCPECQDVVPCAGCDFPERSDDYRPCQKCLGKKPHRHHCAVCDAEYECGWIEKMSYCWAYATMDVPCTKHSREEALAFFQKKLDLQKGPIP